MKGFNRKKKPKHCTKLVYKKIAWVKVDEETSKSKPYKEVIQKGIPFEKTSVQVYQKLSKRVSGVQPHFDFDVEGNIVKSTREEVSKSYLRCKGYALR